MSSESATLTRLELEIMKVIWRLERATVREVYEALRPTRKIAYTTVLTMMKILSDKGFLEKNRDARAFVYAAAKPRGSVIGAMVQDFVDRVFNGAAKPLLLHLVAEQKLSEADLLEISEQIEKSK